MTPTESSTESGARWRRFLIAGVVFFVVTHALALGAMATLLRPGMDPGSFTVAERMAYVASHAWAWRLGWLPWQASALSDLWICVALCGWASSRGERVALRWALAALALDVVSILPEQWAEAMMVTSFLLDAATGELAAWGRDWELYAELTGVWANGGYTLMTACWMIAARLLLGRAVAPAPLEIALLALFLVAGTFTWLATHAATDAATGTWFVAASAVNGLAFPSLIVWTIAFGMRLRRA